ncbi:MAG: hypothetical protein NC928_05480 [Candidatus Omnitrophica bacterium]|nr:hypothetical protein [Candidatus Omnitrophota bacterium]
MRKIRVIALLVYSVIAFWGCARLKETLKCLAGISTQALEEGRNKAIIRTFDCDYHTCYNKTKEILRQIGAYVYVEDTKKNLVAIYVSQTDTTPVGLFFKEQDLNHTQIEISSPSSYAKEFISTKVFLTLEKELSILKEGEGRTDAQEESSS